MTAADVQPEYIPARMVNEFTYCPRLFYYEWVEGVFTHNLDTIEGEYRHQRVDSAAADALPPTAAPDDVIHARSITLSSDRHRVIAKLDLVEGEGQVVTPVDYKRGSPKKGAEGALEAWECDRVQIAVQALVLRDNGFTCTEGVLYYASTKQRVRVPIDEALIAHTLEQVADSRRTAEGTIPLPLVDSPKCPRCSLVGICLPDETHACRGDVVPTSPDDLAPARRESNGRHADSPIQPANEVRRLMPARDDLRPLYLNKQGLRVGKSSAVLKVQEKDAVVEEVRIGEICQVNVFGNIQLSTQAIQSLCEAEVPIAYFSQGGWFYGITHGLGIRNIYLRRRQFELAAAPGFCLQLARALVVGKIRNQRTLMMRNHIEPSALIAAQLKNSMATAERAQSLDELLGIEGNAARIYFSVFGGMLKTDSSTDAGSAKAPCQFTFDFAGRNRRPPRDAVNALLSLAYSLLAKDLTITCQAVGFDPFLGFYHQPRYGRAALPLDLMEPFRPLIADSAVLAAINTRMVTPRDFVQVGDAVALKPDGRKAFFRAYEQRMDALATHPLFGYRVSYRRMLEIQARLLARLLTGETTSYPVFTTR